MKSKIFAIVLSFGISGCGENENAVDELSDVRDMISRFNKSTVCVSRVFINDARNIINAIQNVTNVESKISALMLASRIYTSKDVSYWPYHERENLCADYWRPIYAVGRRLNEYGATEEEIWQSASAGWRTYKKLCFSAGMDIKTMYAETKDVRERRHCAKVMLGDYVNALGLFERSMIDRMFGPGSEDRADRFKTRWKGEFGTYDEVKKILTGDGHVTRLSR